jgi:hypothetical protein
LAFHKYRERKLSVSLLLTAATLNSVVAVAHTTLLA